MLRSWVSNFSLPFPSFWQKFSRNHQVVNTEEKKEESTVVDINLQSIFTWQNKTQSYLAVALTYIALWFLYWALQKPYYIASVLTLFWLLHDLWFNYVWPEIQVPTASRSRSIIPVVRITLGKDLSSQLNNHVNNLVQFFHWLVGVRDDNRGLFCSVASLIFLCIAVIGYFVPGLILAHIAFVCVWGTSCGMNLPLSLCSISRNFVDFEELLPSPSGDDLQVLERACEARTLPGPVSDPSFLDLPSIPAIEEVDASQRADGEHELHFVPMHFDQRDLSPTYTNDEFLPSLDGTVPPVLTRQIMSLAEGVINRGRQALGLTSEPVSDSGAEDFEILSHSDFEQ